MASPHTRFWWVFGTAGVLAMSAVTVWFGISATAGRVNWTDVGFSVVSDQQVDVQFDLMRDPTRAVSCTLEAQDVRHARVGTVTVTVGPEPSSPSRHIESVRTVTRAVTGYVGDCDYLASEPVRPSP